MITIEDAALELDTTPATVVAICDGFTRAGLYDQETGDITPDGMDALRDVVNDGGDRFDRYGADQTVAQPSVVPSELDGIHGDVIHATRNRELAAYAAEDATAEWEAAIRVAVERGGRVAAIADLAGISRERVYQIRDGRR